MSESVLTSDEYMKCDSNDDFIDIDQYRKLVRTFIDLVLFCVINVLSIVI